MCANLAMAVAALLFFSHIRSSINTQSCCLNRCNIIIFSLVGSVNNIDFPVPWPLSLHHCSALHLEVTTLWRRQLAQ